MAKRSFRRPLQARDLRWRCLPSRFRWKTTAEAEPLLTTIGQEGALEALRLGVELYGPGYNVFVAGLPGLGKTNIVTGIVEGLSPFCALPKDRVYVNNFRHPERPRLLELPRGDGPAFVREMDRALERVAEGVRTAAEDEATSKRREEVTERFRAEERKAFDEFEAACAAAGFAPGTASRGGQGGEPDVFLVVGDSAVAIGNLDDAVRAGKVPAADEERLRASYAALRSRLADTLRKARVFAQERQRAIEGIEREVAERLVSAIAGDLRDRFPVPEVAAHLLEARGRFVERFSQYSRALLEATSAGEGGAEGPRLAVEEVFREFRVNLLLDSSQTKGCPTVVEHAPTWTNLFGQVEREVDARGNARTDFLLVRAGSLLRADGGYLVLQVRDVLEQEGVWDELKRVLKHRHLDIRMPADLASQAPTVLVPDAIPVNVKVILIGEEGTWEALRDADPDFADIFKVKATFERDTPLRDRVLHDYASFFSRLATEEGLRHLDRTGLAALAEEGVREAGRKGRISVRFGRMSDIVREADWVARKTSAEHVTAEHVKEAMALSARRRGVEERRLREAVRERLILVETTGARVGTVNGLAVYDFGDYRFGKVARITAAVGAGQAGIVNVERLADLSGSTHDKGVLILSGYVRETFGSSRPLAFTASLVFEQSYGGVEGDSATCAEVFAILSSLAGVPVRQDLAVTGSMNQHGDVQAVGGVNDKIEGFFDLCRERGLSGTQGVVIPKSNVGDLMLREDVVSACAERRFAIYAVDRVEEGIELLTGRAAGVTPTRGVFRKGSLYAAVDARLESLARSCADYAARPIVGAP